MGRSLEILERLVAFPTLSRTSNLDLVAFLREVLAVSGVEARIVASEDGGRANLHAVIGPPDVPGVLLSGHTDVVPTDGQAWTSDPFRLARRGDKVYGRGTADMKGFLASALAAAETAARRPLARPLHLAFSYDEEIGCVGVRRLIDDLKSTSVRPLLCIVGEPTSMQTVVAHKGKTAARILTHGHECHSSHAPEGLNAIHLALDMVATLRALQAEIEADGLHDADYTVPFTTLHAGTIRGGTALNIVPGRCEVDFEIRNLPGDRPERLMDRLFGRAEELTRASRARFPDTGVAIEIVNAYPGLDTPAGGEAVRTVDRLAGAAGRNTRPGKIAFGTEGGLFHRDLGIPAVVCGPGSIGEAHKADEFLALDQLARCDAMLARLVDELAAE